MWKKITNYKEQLLFLQLGKKKRRQCLDTFLPTSKSLPTIPLWVEVLVACKGVTCYIVFFSSDLDLCFVHVLDDSGTVRKKTQTLIRKVEVIR